VLVGRRGSEAAAGSGGGQIFVRALRGALRGDPIFLLGSFARRRGARTGVQAAGLGVRASPEASCGARAWCGGPVFGAGKPAHSAQRPARGRAASVATHSPRALVRAHLPRSKTCARCFSVIAFLERYADRRGWRSTRGATPWPSLQGRPSDERHRIETRMSGLLLIRCPNHWCGE
jgi:hypothetical protein